VTLTLERAELGRFKAFLQRGVAVRARAGRSVLEFLVDEVGLTPEYVRQRITTVFLDGQVVDVLEDAILHPGARLALSAAMPGLVGATLRRSGPYAAMRAAITRNPEHGQHPGTGATTVIQVKLFNLLLEEIGPVLLERGVLLDREAIDSLGYGEAAAERSGEPVELRVRFR
jgi:hypothetical protein